MKQTLESVRRRTPGVKNDAGHNLPIRDKFCPSARPPAVPGYRPAGTSITRPWGVRSRSGCPSPVGVKVL